MSWREAILAEFSVEFSSPYIAEDPDSLLAEPTIQTSIQQRGFELVHFEDSVSFRYWYESHIRPNAASASDVNAQAVIIVIDGESVAARDLPYDIVSDARVCSLSLNHCFPDLFYTVIQLLQPEELDALDHALKHYTPGKMGDIASRDFVLRHVYQISPEIIQSPSDLLRTLLRTHYRDIAIPTVLKDRIIQLLRWRQEFTHWPLQDIVANGPAFFAFLQQYWPNYVEGVLESLSRNTREPDAQYHVADRLILPFGHDDVRVYVDNLFLEGFLHPIEVEQSEKFQNHWCIVGIQQDPAKHVRQRAEGLLSLCKDGLPDQESRHQAWLTFAHRWAELLALKHRGPQAVDERAFDDLQACVDEAFSQWMLQRFGTLANHPPNPPAMLHHIPRAIARQLEQNDQYKAAVILIDGLAIDQWVTLRDVLQSQFKVDAWQWQESATFAWVPTITSVSRQALFAGKAPYQFPKSIQTTSSEEKHWRQFWMDNGLQGPQVFYAKNLGIGTPDALLEQLSDHRIKVAGLVLNTVDDIMHGMMLGSAGMHNQVAQWANQGYLFNLLNWLLQKGFKIYLTADHGNVEAQGQGKIKDGATADARGERARVYPNELLLNTAREKHLNTICWPNFGLPTDYAVLLPKGRTAFVPEDNSVVGHGGIALEEVIVPLIMIEQTESKSTV